MFFCKTWDIVDLCCLAEGVACVPCYTPTNDRDDISLEKELLTYHLPANERTFLGYLRTSVMMSMVGTMVAQLFTLHHEGYHVHGFGYFVTGKPLALTCYAFSIGTILLGAVRTWRHQQIMMRGKALVGGFEIHLLGICSMLVCYL